MQDVTDFKPHDPQFDKGQIVAISRAHLLPPQPDYPGFTILAENSIGTVEDRYYVHDEESEFVALPAGWHYAVLSNETETIFMAYEDDLELASDMAAEFNLGDMVVTRKPLSYVPLINNGDNEIIPTGTRAIVTEEKTPDGWIRIAPIEVHTLRQYLVKPGDIEIDEDALW